MIPSTKRPWYMFYPLAGMILLSALWCGYWYIAFVSAKDLVQAKRQEFQNRGLQFTCANESWGGFPFRFEFQCEIAKLQFIQGNETYEIQSTKILAIAQAYNPLHVILLVDGPTSIERARTNLTTIIHERALISVKVGLDKDWDASLETASVNAQSLFTSAKLKLFARKMNGRLDLAANSEELIVQRPDSSAISISNAELVGQTSAALLAQPLIAAASGEPFEISSLKVSQGPVDFAAIGTVFLDPQHRLSGKLSSQTNDIDGVLRFIEPIFALNEQDSATIKSLVTLTGSDPKTNTTKADFAAREGALYWGLIKLADLTPLY